MLSLFLRVIALVLVCSMIAGKRGGRPRPPPRKKSGTRPTRPRSSKRPKSKSKPKKRKQPKSGSKKGKSKSSKKGGKKKETSAKEGKKESTRKGRKKGTEGIEGPESGGGDQGKPESTPTGEIKHEETEGEDGDEEKTHEEQITPDEVMQMNEYAKKSDFQAAKELNAKITADMLKKDDGEQYFTSGRFGAVFLLPGVTELPKSEAESEAPSQMN